MTPIRLPHRDLLLLCAALSCLLAACSSDSGGGDGTGGTGGTRDDPSELEESLQVLGVDTTQTDRVDPDQDALPEDYSPLGSSAAFGSPEEFSDESGANKTDEIFMVNLELGGGGPALNLVEKVGVQIDGDGSVNPGTTSLLHSLPDAENAWVGETEGGTLDNPRSLRDVQAGDVDDDGLEEVVIVYVDTSSANRVVRIKVVEDMEDGYQETEETLTEGDDVLDVSIATGDFDGDGADEVAVVLTKETVSEVLFVAPQSGGNGEPASSYAIDENATLTIEHATELFSVTAELEAGNLDYDNPNELVVVINEMGTSGGPLQGVSNYYVYDDGNRSYALLESDVVSGTDGQSYVARQADVTLGDIDADGIEEIVFAGLTSLGTSCGDQGDAILTAFDDAKHGLQPLSAKFFDAWFSNCPAFGPWRLRFIHVNALDLDGDGLAEVQANQFVWDDLAETGSFGDPVWEMPQEIFVDRDQDAGVRVSAGTTSIETGDVTGDGRENIIVFTQWQGAGVLIYGLSMIEQVGFALLSQIDADAGANSQTVVGPLLVPVNVDMDSPVLKYSDGMYQLVFTEPIIVAAMAAAPCGADIGQNVDACSVSFGQTESTMIDASITVSVSASAHVGVKSSANIPFVGDVGSEFKKTVTATASLSAGAAYTVEKSRVFTTGPLEDGIVFTTIPYDRYTYRILSHPDPELVGGEVVVSLPREPIMLKVERGFYNASVVDESFPINDNVFSHTVGDVQSYPSEGQKNSLLSQYGGLENGPISVGQGEGSDGLGINVSTAISAGASLGVEYEQSVDVTAGPAMAGYSVGYGVSASLTITSGNSTSYSVTVGDLSAETFADNQYSYGMFTYVQPVQDQEFEVINFWVE